MTKQAIRIAIVGGNFGGIAAASHLVNFFYPKDSNASSVSVDITLYDKRQGFVHLIGMTRGLTGDKLGESLFTPHSELSFYKDGKVKFVYKEVKVIHPHKLVTIDDIEDTFDYLVLATGYNRSPPIWPNATNKEEMLLELSNFSEKIAKADDVVVVGGGAVGVEMCSDIAAHYPNKKVTLMHSRAMPIPGPFTDEFRTKVVDVLKEFNVNLMFGHRLQSKTLLEKSDHATRYKIITNQGAELETDLVIECTGFGKPNTHMLQLGIESDKKDSETNVLNEKGLVKVKQTLQLLHPTLGHIFAIGDVNDFQEIKLAGGAMYQGMYAARSIHALATAEESETPLKLEEYPYYFQHLYLLLGPKKVVAFTETGIIDESSLGAASYLLEDMGLEACKTGLTFPVETLSDDLAALSINSSQ